MKKIINILIGVSGSGKSRYASLHPEYLIASSDMARLEIFGDLMHQTSQDHSEVFKRTHQILFDKLSQNSVFYDATNINRKRRRSFINNNIARYNKDMPSTPVEKIISTIFIEPLAILKENNSKKPKEQRVSLETIHKMYITFQIPRVGVDSDEIVIEGKTRFFKEKTTLENILSKNNLKGFLELVTPEYLMEMQDLFGPHETPYHLEDINEHIDMCIKEANNDMILKLIAMFHDLGKSVAKNGGTYRGHELISASYAMKGLSEINGLKAIDKDIITEVIFQHMNAHNGLSEKVIRNNNLDQLTLSYIEKFRLIDDKSRRV